MVLDFLLHLTIIYKTFLVQNEIDNTAIEDIKESLLKKFM